MTKDLIGQQLGNYRLVSLLGRGGFAEVYLGQHVRLSMQAAIKVLHAHLSDEQIQGFQQEAETIAKLVHPHIVRVLDFDVSNDGIPFLVMDYRPNGTLRKQHVKGERIPLTTVVSHVQQIADALQYAHDQRLIHRDVKPENMLIGQRNAILLSDFGIAATAHSTSSMSTQIPVGTIPYMAPEQIQAQARPASDQYALAIVVYEWLCGARPFDGSYTEIFAKHLMAPPPPLRQKVPDLPPDVEQAVLTALAKDPHQRFATVQAFATTLEQASQPKPSFVAPPQRNTAPSRSASPPPSIAFTPPMMPVQTPIEVDTPVAQPLPPTVAAMAAQSHTQAISHGSMVRPRTLNQPSSLCTVPRSAPRHLTRRQPFSPLTVETKIRAGLGLIGGIVGGLGGGIVVGGLGGGILGGLGGGILGLGILSGILWLGPGLGCLGGSIGLTASCLLETGLTFTIGKIVGLEDSIVELGMLGGLVGGLVGIGILGGVVGPAIIGIIRIMMKINNRVNKTV